jgi:putative membrane protein
MSGPRRDGLVLALGAAVLAALVVSGIEPYDRLTWFLETAPVYIAAAIMAYSYRRFPLSDLLYVLIAVHALVLIAGGAYTYARVPLGFWMQDWLHLSRNPYDKIGHFMQGLVPALAAREILLRRGFVAGRGMAAFLAACVACSVSLVYELVEWWSALALGQGADEFLGTQGDPWDTPSDMFFALIGATVAMVFLARLQDARIAAIGAPPGARTA